MPDIDTGDDVLDLDRQRAARLEVAANPLTIRFGGEAIATLPVELPLDVLGPLERFDTDLALLIQQAMTIATGDDVAQRQQATGLVIDMLVARPTLPSEALAAVREIARRLFGDDGYDRFVAQRPSREDIAVVAKAVFKRYGVSLGESSAPSASSDSGGATSKRTSRTSTRGSTSAASTPALDSPDSSAPAA